MSSEVVEEKVLITCPFCDKQLRVPQTYSGMARCPSCSQEFGVDGLIEVEVNAPKSIIVGNADEESPEIEILKNSGGSFEFLLGLIIPIIPAIIMMIYFFITDDLEALILCMGSLCCWPVIGFILVISSETFVKSFRDGAKLSVIIALIIVGLLWMWFFSFVSGGVTN